MAKTMIVKPLGLVIQTAGLVNSQQMRIALEDRKLFPRLRIGEIMARRGWISQQTADFFAEQWPKLLGSLPKEPLGQYLKAAGLIDESQLQIILQEQAYRGGRFGTLMVDRGVVSQKTLDFFVEQLNLPPQIDNNYSYRLEFANAPSNHVANRLIDNQKCEPTILLNLYQQIREQQEVVATGSKAEQELINCGLVVADERKIKLDPIGDRYNFDDSWIQQQLSRLQPYSKIKVKLFGLQALANDPYQLVLEVDSWTGGEPFLNQKIYQILRDRYLFVVRNQETAIVTELVYKYIIDDWEIQQAAPHLIQIRQQLLHPPTSIGSCLACYQKIWYGKFIHFDRSPQQQYLIEIGLIKLEQDKVRVANRIYHDIFDRNWLKKQIAIYESGYSFSANNCHLKLVQNSASVNQQQSSRLLKIFTLLICLGGIGWFGLSLVGKYQQVQEFKQANRLLTQKKYTAAITAYDRALAKDTVQQHLIWINRGYAFLGLNRYQDMLQSCSNATLIAPQEALGWNCQGEALYYQQKYPEALEAFEQATAKNPQEGTFWLNKARVLSSLQQYQQAVEASQQGIELLKKSQLDRPTKENNLAIAFNQKGQNLLKTHQYQESLTAFEQSLANSPDYLSALQGKGIALYELGNYQQAIAIFAEVLQRDDLTKEQQAMSWLYTGISHCQAQQTAKAQPAFKKVLDLTNNSEYLEIANQGCGII